MKTKDEAIADIAQEICESMGLMPVAVLSANNRNPKAIKARRKIANTLYEAGFGAADIASLMKIAPSRVYVLKSRGWL